ncbi:MAG: hypothetical protein NC827_02580 [Candidatus Omnitrophica bacterium]|nr:hypothetical protein [Candidatus Omnitrophota bacterium]MCM8802180.1 hypothetical protein [Candidatus Omnitrophota bacterium]
MCEKSIYNEVVGVIHVHFPLKRAKEYFYKISDESKKAKIDFVILTSHTPEGQREKEKYKELFELEGYYNDVLIIHLEEVDKKKKNHFILFGNNDWTDKEDIENILNEYKKFMKLVVHPYGKHRLFLFKKDYKWEKWNSFFQGLEIWSCLFDWANKTKIYNIPLRYLFFPLNVDVPNEKVLKKWDELNFERKIFGFAGLDIHCLPFYLKILDIKKNFSYKKVFSTLRNHIYLKEGLKRDFEKDKTNILEAIKKGNLFFANDYIFNSSGFYFGEKNGKYVCGDSGKIGDIILIKNPFKTKTNLIRNGKIIFQEVIDEKEIEIEKEGNYRVEVFINDKNWIFSNNIYIRS